MGNQPTHILNSWRIYRRAELVSLIGGESAHRLEAMTPTDAAAFGMRILREMFGSHIPNPLAVRKTVWSRDEFACGANSYIAVGSHPSDLETLAAPVGETLFFAGEATSRNCWATVHGAYLSGLREATRITGDASILPSARRLNRVAGARCSTARGVSSVCVRAR
jgi:monoamine oxidase